MDCIRLHSVVYLYLAYTIKEINAVVGCQLYCAIIICTPASLPTVHEVWTKAFINIERTLYVTVNEKRDHSAQNVHLSYKRL